MCQVSSPVPQEKPPVRFPTLEIFQDGAECNSIIVARIEYDNFLRVNRDFPGARVSLFDQTNVFFGSLSYRFVYIRVVDLVPDRFRARRSQEYSTV